MIVYMAENGRNVPGGNWNTPPARIRACPTGGLQSHPGFPNRHQVRRAWEVPRVCCVPKKKPVGKDQWFTI